MTNIQIKTRISQMLGIARSGPDGVEEWQEIQDVVNDGVIDMLSRTRLYVRSVTLSLTAGEDEYDFGPTVLGIHNLRKVRSDGTPGDELNELSAGDIVGAGTNAYALMGFNRIQFGWIAAAGDKVRAYYTPKPTAMSADSDDPAVSTWGLIPAQYHDEGLCYYGGWKMGELAGDPGSSMGERWRIQYEGQDGQGGPGTILGRIKTEINKRSGSGSASARRRRAGQQITSDICPAFWQG